MIKKYKKIIILFLFTIILTAGLFWFQKSVHAQPDLGLEPVGSAIGLPATDIRLVVANIIRIALGLLGIVALVLILYAGFVWMTAGGEEEKISTAKKILVNAVIGLVIILSSYAIASFVISSLTGATTDNGGLGGPGGGGGGDNPYFPAGIFYVDSLPSGGQLCVRNVHLAITFNKEVDVDTLNGNVVVQTAGGAEQSGAWQLLSNSTAAFVPNGDCGSGPADCFAPSTAYTLHFKNGGAIKTADGQMSLNCVIKAGCADVSFTTGDGIDRLPPQIKIESIASDVLRVGSVVPVQVSYIDDNGVQKIDLSADNYFVGSQTVSGCQKTGSVTVNWPTIGIASGLHILQATGYDWSALNYSTTTNVSLLPQHCFDSSLQADLGEVTAGPPACGGECGACAGSPCASGSSCASGYCDPVGGVCVDKMRINGVSPLSGGPGTLVSVSGNYFGGNPGRVYFAAEANKANLSRTSDSGWIQANLGCGANSWKTYQILAEVPGSAVGGPVQVIKDSPTSLWVGIGDFENSTDGFMTYTPGSFQLNGDAKVGSKSLEVSSGAALNTGSTYGGTFVVMPPLTVGKTYTISFWSKSLSANPAPVSISAQSGGGDQNCLSFNFTPTANWQKYSRTCKLDLVKNSLYIWGNAANQKLLVDGLKITNSEVDFTDYFVSPSTPESNWGPEISDFTVNTLVRPGLCGITPASDLAGAEVALVGKNFGIAVDKVFFGLQSVPVIPVNWTDTLIRTRVPLLDAGAVGVKVTKNNLDSNSIKFFVEQGLSGTAPFISGITPDHGGKGEYITITGNNFGEQTGRVLFKENDGGQPGEVIEGSFTFPPGCQNTWTDKQIIVKFPNNNGVVGRSYFVQVRPADAAQGTSPIGPEFDLQNVAPSPGVCNINPVSGPVPFAASAPDMKIIGEHFGLAPEVYFWAASASSTSIAGRMIGVTTGVTNLSVGQVISTRPLVGTLSGPVVVLRKPDDKLSNPQSFSAVNCVKNNNTCPDVDTHCCAVGSETGMCKPSTELCEGQTLSAGYIWRFSTKDIPKVPRVIERCDTNTDLGANIPTPSPSASWDTSTSGVHHNVCRTAAVVVEFNLATINNISRENFLINECNAGTVSEVNRTCTVAGTVAIGGDPGDLIPELSTENTSYLELNPDNAYNNGKWKDGTWYQVVLRSGITAGTGTSTAPLAKDKPCSADSSYCFVFKADSQDCKMKQVVITPYSYRTSILEEPIKHRDSPADPGEDVVYSGHGLSTQHCIIMDTTAFNWSWGTKNIYYASIFSTNNASARVSSLANTVGVGLINPNNAINVTATATLASANYTGHSPLTVDLNYPQVVDFWPTCLESCTNAEVGVRFNTTMSLKNLPSGPVKLLKCNDENCFNTTPVEVATEIILDSASDYRVLKIANSGVGAVELEANTIYQVLLSVSSTDVNSPELLWSAARLGDPNTHSKPYNKQFTWRFKTKKEKCKISRVDVVPQNYFAEFINDKEIYSSQPYSSPDTCSAAGQKLNPWSVGWNWSSSLPLVAKVTTFSTKGSNPYCTLGCTRKGSSIPVGESVVPVCGNNVVEAGEDCDSPLKGAGCGLDCRRLGNVSSSTCGNGIIEPNLGETCDPGLATSAVGCSGVCLHSGSAQTTEAVATGASICGNGFIGSGEDCDLGISASTVVANSAMRCSENCLHQGARLSNKWCFDNNIAYGGFTQTEFKSACRMAVSRCGDGVNNPDEDAGCDLGGGTKAVWCNDFCLVNTSTVPHAECVVGAQGCSANGQRIGSSLLYTVPSVCGDQAVGIGEDNFCETNFPVTHTGVNPWSLVTGVGLGDATGVPPSQKTDISASTNEETAGGAMMSDKGQFIISCGYKTDTECQDRMGDSWGVAANGCCYLRPRLLKVTPGNTTTAQANICPNTAIEATFDQEIDLGSLKNNIVVARGIAATSTCVGTEDVTSLVVGNTGNNNFPWYKKIFVAVVNFFKNLVGENVSAVHNEIRSVKWCAGEDVGQVDVLTTTSTLSKVIFKLNKPLAFDTDYFVALKDGLRSKKGISIGKNSITNKPLSWKFITGSRICEVDNVSVEPTQVYLNKVGATSTLVANAYNVSAAQVQPIPGYYAWNYLWQPVENSFVNLQTTTSSVNIISAQNRNGEIDVRASAVITSNIYSSQFGSVATGKSHIIVFLCENPWPPKDLYLSGVGPYIIFPYEDKEGNNDGFNLAAGGFDNTSIPPSPSGRYFNFRSYYCADSGSYGTADDLPYLRPAVQVSSAIVADSPTSSLKRFILTSAKNNDAVGIAVFSNPQHLTVAQWFATDRALGGQGFTGNMQTTKIDGYDALTDGNNIYVDALNFSDISHNLYSNIYLFSINANAQPDTKKVFESMISNLRFNTNLTNYGYCGATMANPGASTTCQTDLDCSGTEICSVQIDKLKRNYQRLRDLNEIQNLLGF